jgi:dTDP-4-amino-4,6-dideoxygalactose transaminase
MSHINIPYEDLKRVNEKYFKELTFRSKSVIESGWYILGENVREFEKEFAAVNNIDFCVGVASGLDALVLGLAVFDFPKGGKVLVPSNAYIACILAVIQAGLTPVLVEPNVDTCNMDVYGLKNRYTDDCVAILAVHMYGRICPMTEIMEFAKINKLKVIEDCAQSHFAQIHGKKAGTFGDIGAFSFYPTKNLGALGDAGAIVCSSEEVYLKLQALRNYGSNKKYYNKYIGWNSRLDEIQATFLRLKLPDYKLVLEKKREIANTYLNELAIISQIKLPKTEGENHVWHIFNIRCEKRNELKQYLYEMGIGTEIHYPIAPGNQEGYCELFLDREFPIANKIHNETLSLPISIWIEKYQVDFIIETIQDFYSKILD